MPPVVMIMPVWVAQTTLAVAKSQHFAKAQGHKCVLHGELVAADAPR